MELKWIVVVAVLVGAIALVLYLIQRNQKDKDEVVKYLNPDSAIEKNHYFYALNPNA